MALTATYEFPACLTPPVGRVAKIQSFCVSDCVSETGVAHEENNLCEVLVRIRSSQEVEGDPRSATRDLRSVCVGGQAVQRT